MPEIQHTEYISAAARALEAAAQPCQGAEYGSSALQRCRYAEIPHRADGAEYKHPLNAPDGSISPITVAGTPRLFRRKTRKVRKVY